MRGPLPVYNWDRYPGYDEVCTIVELSRERLEAYIMDHAAALHNVVRNYRLDVVHANHVVAMPEVARRVAKYTSTAVVVTPHGSAIEYAVRKEPRLARLARKSLMACDALIVGGEEMLERLDAVFGAELDLRSKSYLVPVGVNLDIFVPRKSAEIPPIEPESIPSDSGGCSRGLAEVLFKDARRFRSDSELLRIADKARARYEHRTCDEDTRERLDRIDWASDQLVGFAGKLVAGKGLHSLIVSLIGVFAENDRARMIIVGEGSFREPLELLIFALTTQDHRLFETIVRLGWAFDGKQAAPLESLQPYCEPAKFEAIAKRAEQVRLSERIHFIGYLSQENLVQVLQRLDTVVLPSAIPEAYPLALVEALAVGLVPIATDFGGTTAFFDSVLPNLPEGRRNVRVDATPERTVASLTEIVLGQLVQPRGPVAEARQIAVDRYGWAEVSERVLEVYEQAVRAKKERK